MEMDQKTPESKESGTELVQADTANLAKESIVILNQIIAEQDPAKTKDLTYLFNQNQNKKTKIIKTINLSFFIIIVGKNLILFIVSILFYYSNKILFCSIQFCYYY